MNQYDRLLEHLRHKEDQAQQVLGAIRHRRADHQRQRDVLAEQRRQAVSSANLHEREQLTHYCWHLSGLDAAQQAAIATLEPAEAEAQKMVIAAYRRRRSVEHLATRAADRQRLRANRREARQIDEGAARAWLERAS